MRLRAAKQPTEKEIRKLYDETVRGVQRRLSAKKEKIKG